jgi:hypothetical protein
LFLVSSSFTLSASWQSWAEQSPSPPAPTAMISVSTQTQSNGASWLWTKTSETMNQNKSFLLFELFLSGILSQWQKWLIRWYCY